MFTCSAGIGYAIRYDDKLFIDHCLTSGIVGAKRLKGHKNRWNHHDYIVALWSIPKQCKSCD